MRDAGRTAGAARPESVFLPTVVRERTQLPVAPDGGLIDEPTKLNVLLAFEPRVVIAAMHTTIMRASITAYSTAVGPSSAFRKLTRFLVRLRMIRSPVLRLMKVCGSSGSPARR